MGMWCVSTTPCRNAELTLQRNYSTNEHLSIAAITCQGLFCVFYIDEWMNLILSVALRGRYCCYHPHLTDGETEAWNFTHLPGMTQLDLTPDPLAPESVLPVAVPCHLSQGSQGEGWWWPHSPPSMPPATFLYDPAAPKSLLVAGKKQSRWILSES